MNRFLCGAAFAAALASLPLSASADSLLYQSATFVDESQAIGDYFIDNTRYLGAVFTVSTPESLTRIGGNFTQYGDGNPIFGAIVPVVAGLPGDVAATAVAHTMLTPTGGDQTAAIAGVLNPGTYAVVFGSGLYGTTGQSGLVDSQLRVGTPMFVQYTGGATLTASAFTDDTLRVTVYANAVPEPATGLLWAAGSLALGFVLRRRAR